MIGTTIAFVDTDGVACIGIVSIVSVRKAAFCADVTKSESPRLIGKRISFGPASLANQTKGAM